MNDPTIYRPHPGRRAGLLSMGLGGTMLVIGAAMLWALLRLPIEQIIDSSDPRFAEMLRQVGLANFRIVMIVVSSLIVGLAVALLGLGLFHRAFGGIVSGVFLMLLHLLIAAYLLLNLVVALPAAASAGGFATFLLMALFTGAFVTACVWSFQSIAYAARAPAVVRPVRPAEVSPLGLVAQRPMAGYYFTIPSAPEQQRL